MVIDILATFPFEIFTINSSFDENNIIKAKIYNNFFKLIRAFTLNKRLVKNKTLILDSLRIQSHKLRILRFCFDALVSSHIIACLWYFLARIRGFNDDTWLY